MAGRYGDEAFTRCMFAKSAVVHDVLALGRDLLFQDVDIVWRSDPLQKLSERAEHAGLDFQFMYDGPNRRFQPMQLNSGFFFVRCTELSRYAWTLVFENHDKVMSYRSQQMVVNQVMSSLRERGLRVSRLPEREYRNGHGAHRIEHRKEEAEFSDARVVHVSWTADIENKLAKLRDNGLWYL
jgi:hypothetical protein